MRFAIHFCFDLSDDNLSDLNMDISQIINCENVQNGKIIS